MWPEHGPRDSRVLSSLRLGSGQPRWGRGGRAGLGCRDVGQATCGVGAQSGRRCHGLLSHAALKAAASPPPEGLQLGGDPRTVLASKKSLFEPDRGESWQPGWPGAPGTDACRPRGPRPRGWRCSGARGLSWPLCPSLLRPGQPGLTSAWRKGAHQQKAPPLSPAMGLVGDQTNPQSLESKPSSSERESSLCKKEEGEIQRVRRPTAPTSP